MSAIPETFRARKEKILQALSVPDEEYKDLSPKGSVDDGIKDLINEVNSIDGLVTTSSCAGRISVFLEGSKDEPEGARLGRTDDHSSQRAVPGGKGIGGRWLFISHDPVSPPTSSNEEVDPVMGLFGLSPSQPLLDISQPQKMRLIRFQFEPMILHVMTASLKHAQSVLASAINAGFRESGVQSLKNLEDPKAFPMVAIRSSGLALSSLIGFMDDHVAPSKIISLVNGDYLRLLLEIANERFKANTERIERFRHELLERTAVRISQWEDASARKERKKVEGLKSQSGIRSKSPQNSMEDNALFLGDSLFQD